MAAAFYRSDLAQ
jgi:hypothetical protein